MAYNEIDEWAYANLQIPMAHEVSTGHRFDDAILRWAIPQGLFNALLGKVLGSLFLKAFLFRTILIVRYFDLRVFVGNPWLLSLANC